MSRSSERIKHPQAKHFETWRTMALRDGPLASSTVRVYAHDISRFLRSLKDDRLDAVTSTTMAAFLGKLDRRSRSRMMSALSDFFAFAFAQGLMRTDPLRSLKYRRSRQAINAQMDFFDLLTEAGVRTPQKVLWADFLVPLINREERKLRVAGRLISVTPYLWNRLEVRFRNLAASQDLRNLLKSRIA